MNLLESHSLIGLSLDFDRYVIRNPTELFLKTDFDSDFNPETVLNTVLLHVIFLLTPVRPESYSERSAGLPGAHNARALLL